MAEEKSLLETLDEIAPIKQFDAFPKLPSTYKNRTKFGGFMTIFVVVLSVLLVLNDVAEYIWGWSDYEFVVDRDQNRLLNINVDMVVNTPCMSLSIDLRDAVGDRLHLSDTFRRDGTLFDISQAHDFKEHQRKLSTREIVAASRRSRGFFSLFKANRPQFRKTWNHVPDGDSCRIFGSVTVRKLSGNFHITTLGHGYGGHGGGHTDHSKLNMSHIITEFSFGPYYPDITQPLDYSFETTDKSFVAFQYFITVVPTTYYAPRSRPLYTSQYSVTHYIKPVEEGRGTPGIFFRYDLDPVALEIHQRTTSFVQFMVRIVGVIGGVWVCFGWGIKITSKISTKVGITTEDETEPIAEVTGLSAKKRWRGADLIRRKGAGESGSPWSTPMASPYVTYSGQGTPASPYASFSQQGGYSAGPYTPHTPNTAAGAPPSPYYGSAGLPPSRSASSGFPASPAGNSLHVPASPYTPSGLPLSPLPGQGFPGSSGGLAPPSPGYPTSPLPPTPGSGGGVFASQQGRDRSGSGSSTGGLSAPPPPRRGSGLRNEKKED